MNKFILHILNHPLVKIFLTILSYFIFPFQSQQQKHLVSQPLTPKKNKQNNKTKTVLRKYNESNESHNEQEQELSDAVSIASSKSSPINKNNLFPSTITNIDILVNSSCKPCSTSVSTKLLPFKNNQGEIEWTFTDDSSMHSFNNEFVTNNISPTISNSSSNNESVLSNNINNQYPVGYNTMKSDFKGYQNDNNDINNVVSDSHTPKSLNTPSPSSSTGDLKSHQCPHCEATFKLRGYLTRHLKKHSIKKAYSCPFHQFSIYIDENNITHKCHPTGGFSRRDTYKTHLKSRHFKYPKGTKTKERPKSSGNCSMCGEYFPNSEIWCEVHIEGGECKFLPQGFKGKSRIKNRLKKELKKKGYSINSDEPIDYSKLVNEISKSSNEKFGLELLPKEDEGEDSGSPYSSDLSQSPISESAGSYQIMHQSSSPVDNAVTRPTSVQQSQVSPQTQQQHPQYQHPQPQALPQHAIIQNQNIISRSLDTMVPIQQEQAPQHDFMSSSFDSDNLYYKFLDYDDEFCLDVDQLNQFSPNSLSSESPGYKVGGLQQQYQAMQNQLQMNLMMYQQQSQNQTHEHFHHHQQPASHQQQQQRFSPHGHPQGSFQCQSSDGFNSTNTGLNAEDVHLDSNYLQPQYVQY